MNYVRFLQRATEEHALCDMTVRQLAAFDCICRSSRLLSVIDISELFGIPRPSVSRAVDRFVRADLAERSHSETDRRLLEIRPTARGRELHARIAGESA